MSRYDWQVDFTKEITDDALELDGWQQSSGCPSPYPTSLVVKAAEGGGRARISSPVLHLQKSAAICVRFTYFLKQTDDGLISIGIFDEKSRSSNVLSQLSLSTLASDKWTNVSFSIPKQKHAFKVGDPCPPKRASQIMLDIFWRKEAPWFSLSSLSIESGVCGQKGEKFEGLPGEPGEVSPG